MIYMSAWCSTTLNHVRTHYLAERWPCRRSIPDAADDNPASVGGEWSSGKAFGNAVVHYVGAVRLEGVVLTSVEIRAGEKLWR